ncbi:RNA polymerase sigma factor [Streptomyces sp. NPDC006274]|uniref:RNA polymerase sigma factor n=1 Tax=unclassified Streptomyces TaxID=2593676 RepID=UPI0033A2CD1B
MIHGSPEINPPEAAPEPELLVRARAGDSEAFAALYNEHHAAVSRLIKGRVRDRHLAEDLTQDVFVRALRRINTFTWQGRDVGNWLCIIARNIVTDYYKSSRYRREWTTDEVFSTDTVASAEDLALRHLEIDDVCDSVTGAIAALTSQQRTVVTHRYLEELSVADTAAVMGCSVGAVKTMSWRAFRSLGRELRSTGAVAA